MNDRILLQSKGPAPDMYDGMVDLIRPITEEYAWKCDADYRMFVGLKDATIVTPKAMTAHSAAASWNRIALMLDAFADGYRKVAWFDLDTLVVDMDESIFDQTDDTTPLQFVRIPHAGDWIKNDGVLVANNLPATVDLLEDVWAQRHGPLSGFEQGPIDAHALAHPETVGPLDPRFNWFGWDGTIAAVVPSYPPRESAVVLAWHACPNALARQLRAYEERYG